MGFRENLKSELEYSGMLVKELAAESGVNKWNIDNYLNSREQLPSVDTAVKIAQALGVSVEYLVTGEETTKSTVQNLSKTSRLIGQLAEQLDAEKREFALEFMRWLVGLKGK